MKTGKTEQEEEAEAENVKVALGPLRANCRRQCWPICESLAPTAKRLTLAKWLTWTCRIFVLNNKFN